MMSKAQEHFRNLALEARRSETFYGGQMADYAREAETLEKITDELSLVMPRAEHDRIVGELVAKIAKLEAARPRSEWNEDIGPVLWWCFPVVEPPYCGTPLDNPRAFEVEVGGNIVGKAQIGGWPGYHTHWTPLVQPQVQP